MSRSGRAARSWAARRGRTGADRGAGGQVGELEPVAGAEHVADVHALGRRREAQAQGGSGGQVLERVHGDVACVPQQGVAQGRDEDAGAAHLGERTGQDVAVGPDVHELHREAADGGQLVRGLLRLGQGQLAGPGADPDGHCCAASRRRGRCGVGRVRVVAGADGGVRSGDGGLFAAEVGAAAGPADVVPGAQLGQVRPVGDVVGRGPFADQVHHAGDELAVRARGGDTGGRQAQVAAGFQGLGVQVPDNFHVVADEAERHDDDSLDALAGEFLDGVVDVRFEPRHVRGAGAGLVHQRPGRGEAGFGLDAPDDLGGGGKVLGHVGGAFLEFARLALGPAGGLGVAGGDGVRGEQDLDRSIRGAGGGQLARGRRPGRRRCLQRTAPRSRGGRSTGGPCPPRACRPGRFPSGPCRCPRGTGGSWSNRSRRWW